MCLGTERALTVTERSLTLSFVSLFVTEDFVNLFFSSPEISSEDTGHLCQSVLQDFSSVLSVDPASSNTRKSSLENGVASQENGGLEHDVTDDEDGIISSSLMVKLVVMAIATVTRLQSKGKEVVCLCYVRSMSCEVSFSNSLIINQI